MIGLGLGITMQQRRGVRPFASLMSTLLSGAAQLIAHPLEYGNMFIDRAGSTPVTAPGQLVGRVLDVGGGNYHATAVSDAARGVYREVGGLKYIEYNGVNTAYQTPVLPAPGVDKAQVFAGLRKLSEVTQIITELSDTSDTNNGALTLATLSDGRLFFRSKGTASTSVSPSGFVAPTSNVVSLLGDISAPKLASRSNGTQVAESTADQGAGNYLAYPIYIGARAGTSLFFNGHHYGTLGPIVRFGTNATADQIAAAEAYYTTETGL